MTAVNRSERGRLGARWAPSPDTELADMCALLQHLHRGKGRRIGSQLPRALFRPSGSKIAPWKVPLFWCGRALTRLAARAGIPTCSSLFGWLSLSQDKSGIQPAAGLEATR